MSSLSCKNIEFIGKFIYRLGKGLVNKRHELLERNLNVIQEIAEECFNFRKLLLINVTVNGRSKLHNINLPDYKFVVFQADYNSEAFDCIRRFLPEEKAMYVALIHFPDQKISECVLIDEFDDDSDLERCDAAYSELFKDNGYDIIVHDTEVVDNQDVEYYRLEQEALLEHGDENEINDDGEENNNEYDDLVKRYNNLPPEHEKGSDSCVSVKAKLPSGKTLMRSFGTNEKTQNLFDFIYYETFPNKPIIRYGFPSRELEYFDMTFEENGFSLKEVVIIEFE